jgi:tripartite-type tricarboxylate transporter receptor subunit TctC
MHKRVKWRLVWGVLFLLLSAVCVSHLGAQQESIADFPSKPMTLIVQFSAGGTTDLSARKLAALVENTFKQPMIVENKPGGTGNAGHNAIAKAKPDGYTIGTLAHSGTVLIPHMRTVPFNTKEDFSFIIQYAEYLQFLCVKKEAPWKALKELIEYARQNPGAVTYSTSGAGSAQHLCMEMLAKQEKLKLVHVPYKGGADGVAAILGGHVVASLGAEVASQAKAGNVRALAVLGQKRLRALPDVPTFSELGYKINMALWLGVAAPKGVPSPILKNLEAAFTKAFHDPSFSETLDRLVMTPVYRNSEDFRKFVLEDYDRCREIVEAAGMLKKGN